VALIPYLARLAAKAAKSAETRAAEEAAAQSAARAAEEAAARSLAVRVKPRALPAPPKVLALPAPKPGLPSLAAKPRGGQFFPDAPLGGHDAEAAGFKIRDRGEHAPAGMRYQVVRPSGEGSGMFADTPADARRQANSYYKSTSTAQYNLSPEAAAREMRSDANLIDWTPEGGTSPEHGRQLGDWLEKALTKYYKTDFGAPNDPLRDLAARGLHYDPEMTPERWHQTVNDSLREDPIGYYTVPRHENDIRMEHNPPQFSTDFAGDTDNLAQQLAPGLSYYANADPTAQGALMQAAPWLRKQPATDMLYGIRPEMDLSHFTDEMRNAMDVGQSGLPMDLAVRPESLQRMSFPQAVEHVGKINQFRAREMERMDAAKRAETLKLAAQQLRESPVTHLFKEYPDDPRGMRWVEMAPPKGEGSTNYNVQDELQRALKFEGDTMGHCVGGYCPDVMSGQSRIFSLRDAEGMPHVTIETSPRGGWLSGEQLNEWEPGAFDRYLAQRHEEGGIGDMHRWANVNFPDQMTGQDIVQIKGPKNHKPQPEYLPFVQDFVKSGKWGDVGDLRNTDLVRLPDQRFITQEQYHEGMARAREALPPEADPYSMLTFNWNGLAPHFEGYAQGGLAVKKCGCMQCGGLAVRKAA
jgi:hypothetical protein